MGRPQPSLATDSTRVWIATANLRWVVRKMPHGFESRHLQQMMKCAMTGETRWEDVPEVEEEG